MQNIKTDISKLSQTMSGKERARLILKDSHEKQFVNKKGFLTEAECNELLRMPDYRASDEYRYYCEIYERMPVIMGVITEAYLKFKYHFETLRKAHLLLNFAPALNHLQKIIKGEVKDAEKKGEALDILDIIQPVERKPKTDKQRLKHPLDDIKDNVLRAYESALYFFSMKKIVEEVTEALGFSPFVGKDYARTYENYIEEVKLCIAEHNDIMKKAGEDLNLDKTEDFLIKEPTFNTNIYDEWHNALFKDAPNE